MISGLFYAIVEYISPSEILSFRDICLSVVTYLSSSQYWNVVESSYISGDVTATLMNDCVIYDEKVKVTGNENVIIVFRAYLRHKWIELHQTKIEMSLSLLDRLVD